jgi:predicted dehydrogenase
MVEVMLVCADTEVLFLLLFREMSRKIRCAFIGAGDISQLHAQGIKDNPGVELVGVWSRPNCPVVTDPIAVAANYSCKLYSSPEELVADPDVDAVFVLTNMETHCKYALMAMNAGKHVLVEKPVATSLAELRAMQRASEENKVVCMPSHNYIYEPWFQRTKYLISTGALGTVASMHIMYNIEHPESITKRDTIQGVVRQLLTHHAYIVGYLLGNPTHVFAMCSVLNDGSVDKENLVQVTLRMPNNALVHLGASFATDDHGRLNNAKGTPSRNFDGGKVPTPGRFT